MKKAIIIIMLVLSIMVIAGCRPTDKVIELSSTQTEGLQRIASYCEWGGGTLNIYSEQQTINETETIIISAECRIGNIRVRNTDLNSGDRMEYEEVGE